MKQTLVAPRVGLTMGRVNSRAKWAPELMSCFARVLYGLSTTNEQIELGYLLNGSNNGHDPYLARGPWEKASPWITEKGPARAMSTRQAGTSDSSLHRRLGSSAAPRAGGEGAAAALAPRSAALRRHF
jgi:hypothetical protein